MRLHQRPFLAVLWLLTKIVLLLMFAMPGAAPVYQGF